MQETSKQKANKAHCTTAMQFMKHMENTIQKSPRTCQNDTKTKSPKGKTCMLNAMAYQLGLRTQLSSMMEKQ